MATVGSLNAQIKVGVSGVEDIARLESAYHKLKQAQESLASGPTRVNAGMLSGIEQERNLMDRIGVSRPGSGAGSAAASLYAIEEAHYAKLFDQADALADAERRRLAINEQISEQMSRQAVDSARAISAPVNAPKAAQTSFAEMLMQEQRDAEQSDRQFTSQYVNNSKRRMASIFDEVNALDAANAARAQAMAKQMSFNEGQLAGSKAASRFGLVMQQSGYQVQDFAVQIASGQNALVAFSQQGSQLISVFGGPWGAVAAAGLSVGVLAYQIYNATKSAKAATLDVDKLSESIKRVSEVEMQIRFDETSLRDKPAEIQRRIAGLREEQAKLQISAGYEDDPTKNLQRQEEIRAEILRLGKEQRDVQRDLAKLAREEAEQQAKAREEFQKRIDAAILQSLREGRANLDVNGTELQKLSADMEDAAFMLKSADSATRTAGWNMVSRIKQEVDAIKDAIDPMRVRIREQERLNALVEKGLLTQQDLNRFNDMQRQRAITGLASRMPQSMQVTQNAVMSSGLMAGGAGPQQLIDISRRQLAALERLVMMEQRASAGVN